MINYEIRLHISKLLQYSAVLRSSISTDELLLIIKSFSSYIVTLYLRMLEEAFYSRRYRGEWEPVDDPEYIEWLGTEPSHNILRLIKDSIEIVELKNIILIRINPRYKYPGSKRYILEVLNAIDTGTSKFNSRPILKNIVRQINHELPNLWKNYLKKKGVA